MTKLEKRRIRTVKTHQDTTVKLICLICDKPMSYIPVGQRHKLIAPQPVFYHERCTN